MHCFHGGCRDAVNGVSGWKKLEIIADGPKVTHRMDGKSCFSYTTFKVIEKGYIGLQLHSPGDFRMDFRTLRFRRGGSGVTETEARVRHPGVFLFAK